MPLRTGPALLLTRLAASRVTHSVSHLFPCLQDLVQECIPPLCNSHDLHDIKDAMMMLLRRVSNYVWKILKCMRYRYVHCTWLMITNPGLAAHQLAARLAKPRH